MTFRKIITLQSQQERLFRLFTPAKEVKVRKHFKSIDGSVPCLFRLGTERAAESRNKLYGAERF